MGNKETATAVKAHQPGEIRRALRGQAAAQRDAIQPQRGGEYGSEAEAQLQRSGGGVTHSQRGTEQN